MASGCGGQRSACSPSTPTFRVRILPKPTVFSVKFVFENNENKQKDAVVGPFKKLHFSIQLKTAILNVRVKTTTFEKFSRYLNVLTETKKTRNQVSDKTKKR